MNSVIRERAGTPVSRLLVIAAALACTMLPSLSAAQAPEPPVLLEPGELPPPPPGSGLPVPVGWDDPIFANTRSSGSLILDGGEIVSNVSIQADGDEASVKGGAFTLRNSRVRSAEAVRVSNGDVVLEWVYLEADARDRPGNHADVIQCYGRGGDVVLKNSTIRAYSQNATAGFFSADGFNGVFTFENVLFWGGPYGIRVEADGGQQVNLRNVYFLEGSFGYQPYRINTSIGQWENVRWARFENGQLVPGALISRP